MPLRAVNRVYCNATDFNRAGAHAPAGPRSTLKSLENS